MQDSICKIGNSKKLSKNIYKKKKKISLKEKEK